MARAGGWRRVLGSAAALASAIALGVGLAGSGSPAPLDGPPPATAPPAGPTSAPAPPQPVVVAADGLVLTVVLPTDRVPPGGLLEIRATLRNDRTTAASYAQTACPGAASATVDLAMPAGDPGREWDGIRGAFKGYALAEGFGPGLIPWDRPLEVPAGADCVPPPATGMLAPGASVSNTLTWRAEIVDGLPAPPGQATLVVRVAHDADRGMLRSLEARAPIRVEGGGAPPVAAGQALDALLADRRFTAWLVGRAPRTWSLATLYLVAGAADGKPPVAPAWDIELVRDRGVPRSRAIGFVDAASGELVKVTFCAEPCRR